MNNIFGNATPIYRGIKAQSQLTSGLSGLLGNLFGRPAPSYKSVDGRRVSVEVLTYRFVDESVQRHSPYLAKQRQAFLKASI